MYYITNIRYSKPKSNIIVMHGDSNKEVQLLVFVNSCMGKHRRNLGQALNYCHAINHYEYATEVSANNNLCIVTCFAIIAIRSVERISGVYFLSQAPVCKRAIIDAVLCRCICSLLITYVIFIFL